MEIQPVEFPLAQNIGQRLTCQQALRGVLHGKANILAHIHAHIAQQFFEGFAGEVTQQLPGHEAGILLVLLGPQGPAAFHIELGVCLYHRSAPSSSGRTALTAAMATSIMESSGSLVVKFWNHMPGAVMIRVKALSCLPAQRLIS